METFKEKQKTVYKRQQALRDSATKSELILKAKLAKIPIKAMFQKGFIKGPNYVIVDFYIPSLKLCIEVDGGYHNTKKQIARDLNKDEYLTKYRKFKLLRMTNADAENISMKALKSILGLAR